jgi:hypothetical protein
MTHVDCMNCVTLRSIRDYANYYVISAATVSCCCPPPPSVAILCKALLGVVRGSPEDHAIYEKFRSHVTRRPIECHQKWGPHQVKANHLQCLVRNSRTLGHRKICFHGLYLPVLRDKYFIALYQSQHLVSLWYVILRNLSQFYTGLEVRVMKGMKRDSETPSIKNTFLMYGQLN